MLNDCDEVMSGWGRTGYMFAHQKFNVKPDIVTTAKGITSGFTIRAVILKNVRGLRRKSRLAWFNIFRSRFIFASQIIVLICIPEIIIDNKFSSK